MEDMLRVSQAVGRGAPSVLMDHVPLGHNLEERPIEHPKEHILRRRNSCVASAVCRRGPWILISQ